MRRVFCVLLVGCLLLAGCAHGYETAIQATAAPAVTPSESPEVAAPTNTIDQAVIDKALAYVAYLTEMDYERTGEGWDIQDGVLSISGDYGMTNWLVYQSSYVRYNLEEYLNLVAAQVEHVVLTGDITSIPDSSFWGMSALKTVELPDSLLVIGTFVFYGCYMLESIDIPDSVIEIKPCALANAGFKEVTFPPGLKILRYCIVTNSADIEEIRVPASVEYIEEDALLSHVKRIIFEGVVGEIAGLSVSQMEDLQQLVFLAGPPIIYEYETGGALHGRWGLAELASSEATIYYLHENKQLWAPNGETEWLMRPLVAIDSLEDLPPLN